MDFSIKQVILRGETRRVLTGHGYGIFWVVKGECTLLWQEKRWRGGQEDVLLLKPGQCLTVCTDEGRTGAVLLYLKVSEGLLRELSDGETDLTACFAALGAGCMTILAPSPSAMLTKNLANRLYTAVSEQQTGKWILVRGILAMIVVMILRAAAETGEKAPHQRRGRFLLDDVFVFIHANLEEKMTLKRLEKEFFVSYEHIAREFRKQTGETIHTYILKLRLEKSCELLKDGELASNVWQKCGFRSCSYFFQAFKRCYGMTPRTYAKAEV